MSVTAEHIITVVTDGARDSVESGWRRYCYIGNRDVHIFNCHRYHNTCLRLELMESRRALVAVDDPASDLVIDWQSHAAVSTNVFADILDGVEGVQEKRVGVVRVRPFGVREHVCAVPDWSNEIGVDGLDGLAPAQGCLPTHYGGLEEDVCSAPGDKLANLGIAFKAELQAVHNNGAKSNGCVANVSELPEC